MSPSPVLGRLRGVTNTEQAVAPDAAAPRHWEADVLLRDGLSAHIRPIRHEDGDLLVEFYGRVSDQSKYYRFFSPMPNLSERDVARFTRVDHVNRVAFVMLLSGRMIALGSYEGHTPREGHEGEPVEVAEVAFLVEDAQQGRGIGQLLLEHLAQAGRERGIDRFVAEVLPDNHRMIQTFRDAGYRVVSGYEDGVCSLEFPIEATDTAIGVMSSREHRAEAASIEHFFNPRSVAVIGASRRQDTVGQALVRNLVLGDYRRPRRCQASRRTRPSATSRATSTSRSSPYRPSRCRTSSSTARPRASTA
jgi:ribosomal protein S18 acetylase RimI-like enzyme